LRKILIKNVHIVNDGASFEGDVLIKNDLIEKIDSSISDKNANIIEGNETYLIPGVIDDQVHFREPGLTHKAEIYTESKAAIAGGITSFMEMPNTIPNTLTQKLLNDKYLIGKEKSLANYSFFMGVSNNNLDEALKTDANKVPGLKVFMGSSTGNMLVDNEKTLEHIFKNSPLLIATHCEDEETIKKNLEKHITQYGNDIPIEHHPIIRDENACYLSSSFAINLAKKHNTRLHILHISTAKETTLFDNSISLEKKRITSEACIHHLCFSDEDYAEKKSFIKWNPAVKTKNDRDAVLDAILDNRIDVIATDHAPHTLEEKKQHYTKCPSGGPLVQHALPAMLELVKQNKITIEQLVEKMCHNPAVLFQIKNRGFIREGYKADLVLVNTNKPWQVSKKNILYKCGWSPFQGNIFSSSVTHTIVNGNLVYNNGFFNESTKGEALLFDRR